jgi:hypothetical protein
VGCVGNESSLRLDGVMQADDEAVHAARERGDFCGNPVERDRRRRADTALGKFNGKRVQSRQHAVHRPSDHEPRQRNGDQDRRGRPERRGLCDFLAHHFLLRDLDSAPGIARRVDAPFLARGFGGCIARPGLRRDVDGREGCVDEPALRIPDANRELIFGILIRLCGRVRGGNADSGVERDLAELTVEKLRRCIVRVKVCKCARRQADDGKKDGHIDERRAPQRRGRQDFGSIHPAPRTLRMIVLPNLRRTEWIRTSTALLSTSSPQP